MKILQVFDFFSLLHGGGTVALLYKLAQGLSQKGHEVVIYTSDFEIDKDYIDSLPEVKIYPFHCISSVANFYLIPDMIGEVKRNLKDFDIVHLHTYRSFQNIVVHHYARKTGIPYVLDAHGSIPKMAGLKSGLKWLFDLFFGQRLLRDASRILAETKVGIEEYKKIGAREDKIVQITPPFSVEEFERLPPAGQFRNSYNIKEKHIIMFLGRVHHIKGLDFLVESFAELTSQRDDVILVILGPDDGFQSELENLIGKLNLTGKVLFTGFLGGQEKLAALVDADIVIQASRYEQGARAPLEAVLCGTPIIVTEHTGAGEEVREIDAGYLVEFGNRQQLAEIMDTILSDPSEAKDKAERAARYIRENRSVAARISEYEKLYLGCIEEAEATRLHGADSGNGRITGTQRGNMN
ncbi:MAG: glycosyltransferase [Desulfobacteraceae bacterium]|nr:glycosyltransferase [Desulfobacteraceae bacterium]